MIFKIFFHILPTLFFLILLSILHFLLVSMLGRNKSGKSKTVFPALFEYENVIATTFLRSHT